MIETQKSKKGGLRSTFRKGTAKRHIRYEISSENVDTDIISLSVVAIYYQGKEKIRYLENNAKGKNNGSV